MARASLIPKRQYTLEFKVEAVRLAESVGGSRAAKRLGIAESSIGNWIRLKRQGKLETHSIGAAPVKRAVSELESEVSRLRRELANARLDNEILKKAAAYFAKASR